MSINYEIWGSPETWVDGTTAEQGADIKYPAADKDTYKEQYTSGGIPYNELDETIAFWGIGEDCIFCNPQYLAPYCVGGDINTIDVYQEPVKESKSAQSAIFSHGGTTSSAISYTRRWSFYSASEIEADVQHRIPQGNAYMEQLCATMNYQKMMLIPYVETVADTYTTGDYSTYTLYNYIENQVYNTKQRIVGIGYMIRYGDGINADRSSEYKGPSLLFSFDIEGKDISYNSKPFYAHENGMSALLWSDGSGGCRVPMAINTGRVSGNATIGTADTGFRAKYCPTTEGTSVPLYFYDPDNPIWTVNKTTAPGSGSTVFWYTYPYIAVNSTNAEDVKKYVLKQLAYLGLPFVYDPANAARGQIGNIGVYLPVFDDDGITTGEYKEGTAALTLPNAQWTDAREGSGYDPNKRRDEDTGDDGVEVRPTTPAFTLAGRGTQCYAITPADMTEIFTDIYGRSESSFEDLTQGLALFGSDPMGAIISYKWYPFTFDPATSASIVLGTTEINPSHTYPILQNVLASTKVFSGKYRLDASKNFVNSRATQARLFLPFYGFYELPMPQLISHEIEVEFHYNVPDEVGVWIISWNNVIYDFLECDPAIEIPLTGNNARAIRAAKVGAAINIAAQAAMTAAVVAGGVAAFSTGIAAAAGGAAAAAPALGEQGAMAWGAQVARAATINTNIKTASGIASTGLSAMNTINNAVANVNRLKVNVPFHPAADATTFLNLSMQPYIQLYTNQLIVDYNEPQYKLKVGHACDKWVLPTSMPEESLLKAGGIADMNTSGMEDAEVIELNTILQTGFYR